MAWITFIIFHHSITAYAWSKVGNGWLESASVEMRVVAVLVPIFGLSYLLSSGVRQWLFIATVICWSAVKISNLPFIPNHIVLALMCNAAMIFFWITAKLKKTDYQVMLAADGRNAITLMFLLVYFYAVLHKLNIDFFNPEVSCAVLLYQEITDSFSFLPPGEGFLSYFVIYSTIGLELLIPLMFLFRKTRLIAIITGLIFHYLLALHWNVQIASFSSEFYCIYILFIPLDYLRFIGEKFNQFHKLTIVRATGVALVTSIVAFILSAGIKWKNGFGAVLASLKGLFGEFVIFEWRIAIFLLIVGNLILMWEFHRLQNLKREPLFIRPVSKLSILFLILVIINGLTPYFGLKTATNFSMFSNLRTENFKTNHLFLNPLHLFSYQNDIVEIVYSDIPHFEELRSREYGITSFEFKRIIGNTTFSGPPKIVTVKKDGEQTTYELPKDLNRLDLNLNPISRKLLIFRPVSLKDVCECHW